MTASTRHRLLVATPPLGDRNFDRTVVLMLEHNDEGAIGVVLNRPGEVSLVGQIDGWDHLLSVPTTLFQGGPVQTDSIIALARADSREEIDGFFPILGEVGTIDLAKEPTAFDMSIEAVRVFGGYAGWAPGQLEGELDAGAWIVLPAEPLDAFTPEPESLWRTVLRRQGGSLAKLAALVPDDLSYN